jgi:hypothetical protein
MRRLAAGVLLVLLAACGGGEPAPEAVRGSAGQETTSSTVAATTTTPAPGRTTTTRTGARSTTTRLPAATTTPAPAPAGPRALAPATPGTYRYDTAGATTFAGTTVPYPAVTTVVVERPSGTRQRSIRDLRDANGTGLMTDLTLDYRPEGVYLVALSVTSGFGGLTDVRVFRLPVPARILATGAGPGAHEEVSISAPSPARLVVDALGEERVTVAGQAVDTLVMRIVLTLTPGDISGRQELTVNLDRGSRLWVKERSVTDASAAGGLFTVHSEYTATMQRLTP